MDGKSANTEEKKHADESAQLAHGKRESKAKLLKLRPEMAHFVF